MTDVRLVRHFNDMRTSVALSNMNYFSQTFHVDNLMKGSQEQHREIRSIWKISESVPSLNQTKTLKFSLNKEKALENFKQICLKSGFKDVSFWGKNKILISDEKLTFPTLAYPSIILWHAYSHNKLFFKKFSKSYSPDTINNFESGLNALLLFLKNSKNPSWARQAGAQKRNLAMFSLGMLCNGVSFAGSLPQVSKEVRSEDLVQFRPYSEEIQDYATKALIQMMNFYSWEEFNPQ